MSSREKILNAVKEAQPSLSPLPELRITGNKEGNTDRFKTMLESIGGTVAFVREGESIIEKVRSLFPAAKRVVSSITSIEQYFFKEYQQLKHHSLEDVDVAIIESRFGIAENGAVWVTEEDTKIRVLPFIGEHLVVVLAADNIVSTMHDAYERIGNEDYHFGVFIAGPSKTADIEQSLVLGAHGPKSMTVLLMC